MKYIITLFIFFLLNNAKAEPGLQLQLQDSLGQVDARSSRLAALFVKEGEAASLFLEAGSFQAEFSGKGKVIFVFITPLASDKNLMITKKIKILT